MKSYKTKIRVRYEETDRMGVVYYANYFVWFEIARTEFFREKLGLSYRELEDKDKIGLMVINAKAVYKSPVTYDDLITVETYIAKVKNTSMVFDYKIYHNSTLVATGETSHVFTDSKGKPVRIPLIVKDKLSASALL